MKPNSITKNKGCHSCLKCVVREPALGSANYFCNHFKHLSIPLRADSYGWGVCYDSAVDEFSVCAEYDYGDPIVVGE